MSLKWGIGHFRNGSISTWIDASNAKLTFDIDDSSTVAEVGVALSRLTASQRNGWRTIFRPGIKFMALCDIDDDTDDILAVRFAGFINKTSNPIGEGLLTIQLTSPSEYMKTRFVIDTWSGTVTDPTAVKTFEAASWRGVMSEIIRECFDASGIPSGMPKPPQIIGSRPSDSGTGRKVTVQKSEAKSYWDLLSEVAEESGVGQEWKFVPVPDDTAVDKIMWNVVLGTNATPQINSDDTYSITLDSTTKLSAYGKTIDSSNFFTTLWLQSKTGDEESKDGMDLQQQSVPYSSDESAVLFERYESLGVELEPSEMSAQFTSRMRDAAKLENSVEITLEEVTNPYVWARRLGAMLSIVGIDGTVSAGFSDVVRVTNVSFELGVGTVVLGVQEPQVRYRKLPKQRVGKMVPSGSKNSKPLNTSKPPASGGGGGGVVPPNPWEPGNPEDPGDGGVGAAWGMNAGFEIGTEPVYNNNFVQGGPLVSSPVPWTGADTLSLIPNESNILHVIERFPTKITKSYTFSEAPTFPIGFGISQASSSSIWTAFFQEGLVREPQKIFEGDIITQQNMQAMFENAGVNGLWSRPAPVYVPGSPGNTSFFYVSGININQSTRYTFSLGGKIFIPIVTTVTWRRDNASSNGAAPTGWGGEAVQHTFYSFLEAEYTGTTTIGDFNHKNNFMGRCYDSYFRVYGRAGSFIFLSTISPNILSTCNFALNSGLESDLYLMPQFDSGHGVWSVSFGQFGSKGLCIMVTTRGGSNNNTSTNYYYEIEDGKTSPVIPPSGAWSVSDVGVNNGSNQPPPRGITCFNGKTILSGYRNISILSGPGPTRSTLLDDSYFNGGFALTFCYKNYLYVVNSYQPSTNISSMKLSYKP